jgi:transposase
MKITTIGIELSKEVFAVHGLDNKGQTVLRKLLKRHEMAKFFANLEPCLVGMEACDSAHHWGRKLEAYGHTVKLMAPQFVKPYEKTNKNDAADAQAICEAVGRPTMRFVAKKTVMIARRCRTNWLTSTTVEARRHKPPFVTGTTGDRKRSVTPRSSCPLHRSKKTIDTSAIKSVNAVSAGTPLSQLSAI